MLTREGWCDDLVAAEMALDPYHTRGRTLATVVDIGANIGGFVDLIVREHPGVRIVAYEPEPDNYRVLAMNTTHLANVTIHHTAVWEHDQGVAITLGARGVSHICLVPAGQLCRACHSHGPDTATVPSLTLDQVLADYTTLDFLKVDTEGAEYQIFTTASDDTLAKITYLGMEIHDYFGDDTRDRLWVRLNEHFNLGVYDYEAGHGGIWAGAHR